MNIFHTNNRAEQALLTAWKPGHDRNEQGKETRITIFPYMPNSNGREKNQYRYRDILKY